MVKDKSKPLVIRGARQVGKSTVVRQSAASVGRILIEVNCEKYLHLEGIFKTLNVQQIIDEIESLPLQSSIGPHAILFLDEIQATPSALAALRYFYEERPDIRVICAGSLLEFALTDRSVSMPVGRIDFMHLGPMDFEEFLVALGEEKLVGVLRAFSLTKPMSAAQHQRFLELQQIYCFVGGMPEAVFEYIQQKKLSAAREVHSSLLDTYKADFAKYGLKQDLARLGQLLDNAAQRVAKKAKYVDLLAHEQTRSVRRLLDLLILARLLSVVTHTEASDVPLGAEAKPNIFKLLLVDIGLLNALLGLPWNAVKDDQAIMSIRDGALAEQFVGQELIANLGAGKQELYYWLREGRSHNGEVDYLVTIEGRIVPVEVKAGKSGILRALNMFCEFRKPRLAVRFDTNLPSIQKMQFGESPMEHWQLLSMPLYASSQIERLSVAVTAQNDF